MSTIREMIEQEARSSNRYGMYHELKERLERVARKAAEQAAYKMLGLTYWVDNPSDGRMFQGQNYADRVLTELFEGEKKT